ncbi:MAG: thioredoxin domain-containing protein [Caldilineaceae bacterium]
MQQAKRRLIPPQPPKKSHRSRIGLPQRASPNPDTPGVNMAGDFWRGSPDAPLTVVEFSDFQCPYCRQHSLDNLTCPR